MAFVGVSRVLAHPGSIVCSWDSVGRRGHNALRLSRGGAVSTRDTVRVVSRMGLGGDKMHGTLAGSRGSIPSSSGSRGFIKRVSGRGLRPVSQTNAYQNTAPGRNDPPNEGGILGWIAKQFSFQKKCIPLLRWPKRGFYDVRTWVDLLFDSVLVVLGLCAFVTLLGYSDLVAAAIYRFVTNTLPTTPR